LDPTSTLAFYFDVVNQHNNPLPPNSKGLIQFHTSYTNGSGARILRVTTIARTWADPNQGNLQLIYGFDQEAAATLMARVCIFKTENEELFDVLRWLDRTLIKFIEKFADFQKDNVSSFNLPPQFTIYPQFMYNFRRSCFLQVFNNSPDETAFYRFMLNRETVSNQLTMIQPYLEAYSFDGPPQPVLLSSTSVKPNQILLLDTYFRILIHYGETIASWKKLGYQNQPEYENFNLLLSAPKEEAEQIIKSRFPYPRFVEADQHTSQARFLLATIDPVVTHASQTQQTGEVVFTDDANLGVFMKHLISRVVSS